LPPVNPNSGTKGGGSLPPLLKKLSIALPTLSRLTEVGGGGEGGGGDPGGVGGIGGGTSCAVRLSTAVLPVYLKLVWKLAGRPGVVRASNVPLRPPAAVKNGVSALDKAARREVSLDVLRASLRHLWAWRESAASVDLGVFPTTPTSPSSPLPFTVVSAEEAIEPFTISAPPLTVVEPV
jgi:hypothetical protein